MRHIVGTKRAATRRAAKVAAPAKPAPVAASAASERKPMRVSDDALLAVRGMKHRIGRNRPKSTASPFAAADPAPGVLPEGSKADGAFMAMDADFGGGIFSALTTWADTLGGGSFEEGLGFLGYSYLATLTQRPEYRRISERIATEMTREWIELTVTSNTTPDDKEEANKPKPGTLGAPGAQDFADVEPEQADPDPDPDAEEAKAKAAEKKKADDKTEKLRQLDDELQRLKVKDAFYNAAEQDGWFGRSHIYIDLGVKNDAEDAVSIGNGRNATSRTKVRKKTLKAVRNVEPMWCYPAAYEARDPRKSNFYKPSQWYINGIAVHASRLLTFVGRPMPDILKPAYAFGGLSMSQMAKPYVDNWLRTRQSVADLVESFSVSGIYTNMGPVLQGGAGVETMKRIDLFNDMRNNAGTFALDKETEEFFNVSTPLGTLDALQAQAQEQMSSVSGIPLVILLGITPKGLNASSEGEIRAFYDWIKAYQESFFRDHLQTIIEFAQLSLWGKVDPEIGFIFKPLWSMTEKEEAEIDKLEGEADQIRINAGVLHPEEARKALAAKPGSRYADINVEDVPEPPPEDSEGDDPFGSGDTDETTGSESGADNPFGGSSQQAEGATA